MGTSASRVASAASRATKTENSVSNVCRKAPATAHVLGSSQDSTALPAELLSESSTSYNSSQATGDQPVEAFGKKDDALVSNMKQAMAHPSCSIQFKEQLLPLHADDHHTRMLIKQVEEEIAAMQGAFDRRTASEQIGGGRVSMDDLKAILGTLQAQRKQEAIIELLAARYAVDTVLLRNVAKYYSIPNVKVVQLGDRPSMVAEWQ